MAISKKKSAAVLILAILRKKMKGKNKKKRKWVREWIQRRDTNDITKTLIEELRTEDAKGFKEFTRMSYEEYKCLLEKVRPIISKQDTNMRKAISTETRLLITLRFLATGDSYRSLMFFFRVPHNTISYIVPNTCKALYETLCGEYLQVIAADTFYVFTIVRLIVISLFELIH